MIGKFTIMAGVLALGALAAPQLSSAASIAPASRHNATDAGLVQQVQWWPGGGRCRYWRRECADRWGWGTHRFYRCLRRHDCGGNW